jgi:hypothetical protein
MDHETDSHLAGQDARRAYRAWLPWISINHLRGIAGLEEFDPALYQQLTKGDWTAPWPV